MYNSCLITNISEWCNQFEFFTSDCDEKLEEVEIDKILSEQFITKNKYILLLDDSFGGKSILFQHISNEWSEKRILKNFRVKHIDISNKTSLKDLKTLLESISSTDTLNTVKYESIVLLLYGFSHEEKDETALEKLNIKRENFLKMNIWMTRKIWAPETYTIVQVKKDLLNHD